MEKNEKPEKQLWELCGSSPPSDPILAGLIIVAFALVAIVLFGAAGVLTTFTIYEIWKHVLGVWG